MQPQHVLPEMTASFHDRFVVLFDAHFHRVFRFLDRVSGDSDLAADIAQEAFVKLHERGSLPDRPEAWLISVSMNLFRNARSTGSRRLRLMTRARGEAVHSDALPTPEESSAASESRRRVRRAIDRLPERERNLLLLQAEGYSYHDIAEVLELNESSIGTLLARARVLFREAYQDPSDAS